MTPPTLAEVVARPELLDALPLPICAATISQLATVCMRAAANLATRAVDHESTAPADDELLSTAQAAALLGIDENTLDKRVRRGSEPFASFLVKTGTRRRRFSRQRIEAWRREGRAA